MHAVTHTHSPATKGTIALVANMAWSIYNFRLPVIRALCASGYKVVVIAPIDETVSALLREPCVEFVGLRSFRRNSTSVSASIRMLREFKQVYARIQPDMVIHYGVQANIWGNLAARATQTPSVCVVTGLGYTFLHKGLVPWITRWLYRLSFLKTQKVLFENQDDLQLMVERKMIAQDKTLRVPGCGIDTEYFSPLPPRPASEGGPVFTLMGRLLYDKGIREFAAAAQRLVRAHPQAQCWVLGHLDDDNPAHIQRNELVQWVQEGSIHYKGATNDVRQVVAQSDWIVLPSYREGLSRVLLEGMAMGKPTITTITPGCSETVVEGRTGFLVPVKDADALYKTLLKCCSVPDDQRQQMGALAREKAINEYSAELVGRLYLEMVTEMLERPGNNRV